MVRHSLEPPRELWYFAHPYTVPDENRIPNPEGAEWQFRLCAIRTAMLIRVGYMVFSPVIHSHPIELADRKLTGHGQWLPLDKEIIFQTPFKGIILAPGFEHSYGCCREVEWFTQLNRAILLFDGALERARKSQL